MVRVEGNVRQVTFVIDSNSRLRLRRRTKKASAERLKQFIAEYGNSETVFYANRAGWGSTNGGKVRIKAEFGSSPRCLYFTCRMRVQRSEFARNEVVVLDLDGNRRLATHLIGFQTENFCAAANAHVFAQRDF